jgi:hypothetical protein
LPAFTKAVLVKLLQKLLFCQLLQKLFLVKLFVKASVLIKLLKVYMGGCNSKQEKAFKMNVNCIPGMAFMVPIGIWMDMWYGGRVSDNPYLIWAMYAHLGGPEQFIGWIRTINRDYNLERYDINVGKCLKFLQKVSDKINDPVICLQLHQSINRVPPSERADNSELINFLANYYPHIDYRRDIREYAIMYVSEIMQNLYLEMHKIKLDKKGRIIK